jgi:hypothetical protein
VEKTELIASKARHGAEREPEVRQCAVDLIKSTDRGAHVERLGRLHAFCRDGVDYHREPIEMLQDATITLRDGGDCDDLVILLAALAWSIKYPFQIVPVGDPMNPHHYSAQLGYPESAAPWGDAHTTWLDAEVSVPAQLGEPWYDAERRLRR